MKPDQVIEATVEQEMDIEERTDAILDADFELPIEPRAKYPINQKPSNLAYKWYLKIRPDLRDWWEEFNTELDEKGDRKYRSIYQFMKAKTKNKLEQEYIWEMIGPKPTLKDGRQLRVPWLGDWMLRRQNGFWAPQNPAQIRTLATAFKSQLTNWEAVRSTAPFLVQSMARLMKLDEQLDEAFNGQAFDPSLKGTSPENISRFRLYFELRVMILDKRNELVDKWMEIHGVDPHNPVQMIQNNTLAQQINNPLGIMDHMGQLSEEQKELEAWRMTKQLMTHAKNFNMPLPERLTGKVEPPPEEPQKPVKSKVQ